MIRSTSILVLLMLLSCRALVVGAEIPQQSVVTDLPIHLMKPSLDNSLPMVVFLSGDGGWNAFSETVCGLLKSKGIPVLGFDSQKYFWKSRTPEETALALESAIDFYRKEAKNKHFLLVGYSFGADIVPFIYKRFSGDLQVFTKSLILISPDINCDFEVHLSDMLNLGISKGKYDVVAELTSCAPVRTYCIFGADENSRFPREEGKNPAEIKLLPGNHHYDNNFNLVADSIEIILKNEK